MKEIEIPEDAPNSEMGEDVLDAMLEDLRNEGLVIPGGAEDVEGEEEVEKYDTSERMESMLEQDGLTIDDPVRVTGFPLPAIMAAIS